MVETTAANPELLADQVAKILVQPLEAASVVLSSGPRIFDTAGVLRIPKLVSGAAVGFIGEAEQIPDDADAKFDELSLMPTNRKSLKTILRFTKELSRQSYIGLDAVLKPGGPPSRASGDHRPTRASGSADRGRGFVQLVPVSHSAPTGIARN